MSDFGALFPAIAVSVLLIGILTAAHVEARRLAAHREARRAEAEQAAHFAE